MAANRDLKKMAHDTLREKLVNCEYAPGSMLTEVQICEELGISRTPIREALSRLELEGFIKIIPKKGIYVTDISLNDVMQIFQVRKEVEPIAVKLAGPRLPRDELVTFRNRFVGEEPDVSVAFRLDSAMHLFIIEHCGNRFIIEMMKKVFAENNRVIISSKQNQVCIHDARQEHVHILDLLLDEAYDEAAVFMNTHVKGCERAALDYFYSIQNHDYAPIAAYKMELSKL